MRENMSGKGPERKERKNCHQSQGVHQMLLLPRDLCKEGNRPEGYPQKKKKEKNFKSFIIKVLITLKTLTTPAAGPYPNLLLVSVYVS